MSEEVNNTPQDSGGLTPEQYQRVVQHMSFMSPEIEARFRSGPTDPSLLQLAAQSFSTHQLLERASALGMLAQLQGIFPDEVKAFQQQQLKAREDEAKFEKRMLETMAGTAVMAAAPEAMAAQASERAAYEDRTMQAYAEKSNTGDYWRDDFIHLLRTDPAMADKILAKEEKKAEDQKQQMNQLLSVDAATARMDEFLLANKGDKELNQYVNMPEADLLCSKVGAEWLEKNSDRYYDYQLRLSDLKEAQFAQTLREQGYEGDAAKHPALVLMEQREDMIRRMRAEQDPAKKEELAKQYADFRDQNKQFFDLTEKGEFSQAAKLATEMHKAEEKLVVSAAVSGNTAEVAAAESQRQQANLQQSSFDASVVAAANKPQAEDEFSEPAPKVAAASPPSITIPGKPPIVGPESPLLAQLGAAPEPANDPAADPQLQRRPVAPSGAGMSA